MNLSVLLAARLGRWWICLALFVVSLVLFTWIVPAGVAEVTGNRQLAPKILDEYIMTWTPADAQHFYAAIGPKGRADYQHYYWKLDFWFPVLSLTLAYVSLLSLAFPARSRWVWLNLTPAALWLSDGAENINHFTMARTYPYLSAFSLSAGPWFTYIKWVLIFAIPLLAVIGFVVQRRKPSPADAG